MQLPVPIAAILISLVLTAQSAAQNKDEADNEEAETSPTVQMASRLGAVAGTAEYCQLDPELVEEYRAKAEARLATASRDNVELVVARIEFNNRINLNSSRAPTGGCDQFEAVFEEQLKSLS